MHEKPNLQEALKQCSRESFQEAIEKGQIQRAVMLEKFPREAWQDLPLERYALGTEDSSDAYSRWLEFKTVELGSIKGGSAGKHIIYKHRTRGWQFDKDKYENEIEAWQAIRAGFNSAFDLAKDGRWIEIDELEVLHAGSAVLVKSLHLYFPDEFLPVSSREHMWHFLRLLKPDAAKSNKTFPVRLNMELLNALRAVPELSGWSTQELSHFLYRWGDPRNTRRIVKIAPGEDAHFWSECLEGGYICVGWDEVGDLTKFEAKETFEVEFATACAEIHKGHKPTLTRKARELWKLFELEPGDLVVANKGISKVLAIGEVVEPGYVWREARSDFKHTVAVKWDTSYAREIEPQKRWGTVTVAKVSAELYAKILAGKKSHSSFVVDALFRDLSDALERKGQAILYGPPGTGKTYSALRFAVWWLLTGNEKQIAVQEAFSDATSFDSAERRLSTPPKSDRVWWVVANPKEWNWDKLFQDGHVEYRYGRLRRNYPRVQLGDLVVGYQSSPDRRIVALAKIARAFSENKEGKPSIALEPLAKVVNGLTFDELAADSRLSSSEPMRFNNQGTLFALSDEEAHHLLGLLSERDPALDTHFDGATGVGPLTRLTFHASYSYEDFIEGFRPVEANTGQLSLRLEDGVFKRVCREAQANPNEAFLVLIDEVNRANVAKVFGEIVTLLEKDKRGLVITLPQSKEAFTIPPNLYVLGTMNTADRSIKLLDAALRRRFAFLEMLPDSELLAGAKVGTLALDEFLDVLNQRIAAKEGREKQIGHSFLLEDGEPISEPAEFGRRFRQEILPLLQEYCYEDYRTLSHYIGEKLVDLDGHRLREDILSDPTQLIETLAEEMHQSSGES